MSPPHEQASDRLVVTASLTSEVVRVTRGMRASVELVEEILALDHKHWETTLSVGDIEYHTTQDGPYPNNQMRISVHPSAKVAALHYMDHDDPEMPVSNSFNPARPPPDIYLIFNGDTGLVFPRSAIIPVANARTALHEWLQTRKRPTSISWQPFDRY